MVYYTGVERFDLLFDALGHKTRRRLIGRLAKSAKPISISDFAKTHQLSYQLAGKHVKVLERAKLIRRKKIGAENYLFINQQALAEAERWIEEHRQYWNKQFDSIEAFIKKEKRRGRNN